MPVTIKGRTYYRTKEVYESAGICRNTLLRWLKEGIVEDDTPRDRRGWRLFTREKLESIVDIATRIDA